MSAATHRLDLPALDGANPLGFLAALGVLSTLSETNPRIKLGWYAGARWTAFVTSPQPFNNPAVLEQLATRLRGKPVDAEKERLRDAAQRKFDDAKTDLKNAEKRFKALGLRGKEREAARQREVAPYEQARDSARERQLEALKEAVPSPELALGQRPDCTIEKFRQHARLLGREASLKTRATLDMLAAFGTEVGDKAAERIVATPFCFITGSGHQWFLDTARELMKRASTEKMREALFEPWGYRDEKLTMRWDPIDDRRYALMDQDPTASNNKSATVWMANLLAYIALAYFPCAPVRRGVATACWKGAKDGPALYWPIWEAPVAIHTIRSILNYRAFVMHNDESVQSELRAELRARGIATVFCARRIQVGNPPLHKINFSPAFAV